MKKLVTVQLASNDDVSLFGGRSSFQLTLAPDDVRTTEEIDSYLPGYVPFGGFRASEIAPIKLVDNSTDDFRIYGLNNIFRLLHTETSRQSPVSEVDPETSVSSYRATIHALGSFVPTETEAQAKYNVRMTAARMIADKLALRFEFQVMTLATTLGTWGTTQRVTLGAGFNWNGGASSDPILDLQTRIEKSTQQVTGIYMSLRLRNAFIRHNKVRDHIRSLLGDGAMAQQILGNSTQGSAPQDIQIPGLPPIYVAGAKKLNDTTGNLDDLIGNDVVLTSIPPGSDSTNFEGIQTFKTFRVKGSSGGGYISREVDAPLRGLEGGTMLVAGYEQDVQCIASGAGGLIKDAYQ